MSHELIINAHPGGGVEIALLRDKQLVELHQEKADSNFSVGDVYLASVNKLMSGLNAAFVDVGHEKDAFLHYLDLGPQVKSLLKHVRLLRNNKQASVWPKKRDNEDDIIKSGKITQVLARSQQIAVQVTKEPISNKGPRLSSQLSFAGRYLVLMPFEDGVSISKKIAKIEERNRLKKLVQGIRPENFGVIIRTVAEGVDSADLETDLRDLLKRWETMCEQLKNADKLPQKILGESDRTLTLIRDLANDDFTGIHVNDHFLYTQIKTYLKAKAPDLEKIIRHYQGTKHSIFEYFGVDKQIKTAFGKQVNFLGGSYLVIEHTEALHVIDVNSGNTTGGKEGNQEENALKVNLMAAEEIARQLRLRDMGGIIVIDFIDQKTAGNRKLVYERLKAEMKSDRARHKILPMSPFGLVQITRQRVRPEMSVVTNEQCPTCKGTGEIASSVVIMDEIENRVKYLAQNMNMSGIMLHVHPYIAAFLTKGFLKSPRFKWFFKYKRFIKIVSVQSFQFGEYHFFNSQEEEIAV